MKTLPCLLLFILAAFLQETSAQCSIKHLPASPCPGGLVNFQSPDSSTQWKWDFGNGATSTIKDPSVSYTVAGTYTVVLICTVGGNSCTSSVNIRVNDTAGPIVRLSALSPMTQCYKGNNFCFVDSSTDRQGKMPLSFTYMYEGEGTLMTGFYESSPRTFCYHSTSGLHNTNNIPLTVIIRDSAGCTTVQQGVLSMTTYGDLGLDIQASKPIGCTPVQVDLLNVSKADSTSLSSWQWDFGDGAVINNSRWKPGITHTFYTRGVHDVILRVVSKDGCEDSFKVEGAAIVY